MHATIPGSRPLSCLDNPFWAPTPMLSYRHAFHAGNFADVLKHVVLVAALGAMTRKPKPVFYLETHAGAGRYPLTPGGGGEADEGIARLLTVSSAPAAVRAYLDAVRASNPRGQLRRYPGSPLLARALLRADDRAQLHELHPRDHGALAALFKTDRQTQVHASDGLAALKSALPPRERRGLILIDPPYERAEEYRAVPAALTEGLRRFATGVYLLWYPRLSPDSAAPMLKTLTATLSRPTLRLELALGPPGDRPGMDGCGMLVVNPPYGLAEALQEALPWLAEVLGRPGGKGRVDWLIAEHTPE